MKISQIYVYPIKSLRGTTLTSSALTKHGLPFDRRFMLLKILENGDLKNMHVPHFPEMCLFQTSIELQDDEPTGSLLVTFDPPKGEGEAKTSSIPLSPDCSHLELMDVTMHRSPCKAYNMGEKINSWFSNCFGYEVILAYLGEHSRSVLMSTSGNKQSKNTSGSWLGSITSSIPYFGATKEDETITFADCAPYLVVSETSLKDVSKRLPEGEDMDMSKFRPNIVVSGAESEWEEDYWAELSFGDEQANIQMMHNCARCVSINVDYATGKPGKGEAGTILKKLMKDRRVDQGAKYSPVFGRYGFLSKGDIGKMIAVGDDVKVLRKNGERTVFDWPGLGSGN
ncbi:MOSC domain-containing protein [Aulographum hederae CBS 113979]|uniref:MOSC domain-containing protein n=1 Tax=Aulographum hederae CBS 113979 TaxID=1176131 RepID=A0A6G1GWR6_9PEZI|nr:MOSC domain-containing protein [Aulographum hederae CBS 113979]